MFKLCNTVAIIAQSKTLNHFEFSAIERGAEHIFTEADWSIVPSETILNYSYSKREAEKRAWAIAEEQSRQV